MSFKDFFWEMKDGWSLRLRHYTGLRPDTPFLVFLSGRTDFIEKYDHTCRALVAEDFQVLTMDWRGQGLSGRLASNPLTGHVDDYALWVEDLKYVFTKAHAEGLIPPEPVIVAHSMGGLIALRALQEGAIRSSGLVLVAPFLGIANIRIKFPLWILRSLTEFQCWIGRSENYAPMNSDMGAQVYSMQRMRKLTHDEDMFQQEHQVVLTQPKLALGGVSWGWLLASLNAIDKAFDAPPLPNKILALIAQEEAAVENSAIVQFVEPLPEGRFVEIADARHEILREVPAIRQKALGLIVEFCKTCT